MATFVKLTNLDDAEVIVNLDKAYTITRATDNERTLIRVGFPESYVNVKETPDEIRKKAQSQNKGHIW